MVNQVTEQLLTPAAQTGRSQKSQQDSPAGFDELLQQKRQTADEPAQTDSARPAQRKDQPAAAEGKENVKPQSTEDEEIPDDAKAVLAAMMLQPQPEIVQTEAAQAQTEALAAEIAPVVQTAEDDPVQELAAQVQEQPQQAAMAPAQREQTAETAQPQTQPQQETQQAQVVTAAPETAQTQPQRTDEGGTQQTGTETVEVEQAPERAEDEQPAEAPLFQQAAAEDAVPVKVADPAPVLNQERPLPIESEQAPQQLAEVVMTGMQDGREVSIIRITPENLGPVQLTLTRETDGTLRVALEAANPRTASLLEKHAQNVQNIMADNLREEVRVEVRENQRPQQQDLTEGQDRQQRQQQQRQQEKTEDDSHEFLQRLRLGLIGPEDDEE